MKCLWSWSPSDLGKLGTEWGHRHRLTTSYPPSAAPGVASQGFQDGALTKGKVALLKMETFQGGGIIAVTALQRVNLRLI